MKYTQYFLYTRQRHDRKDIKLNGFSMLSIIQSGKRPRPMGGSDGGRRFLKLTANICGLFSWRIEKRYTMRSLIVRSARIDYGAEIFS